MDKHQIKGQMHKAKGKVKEVTGRTIGNDEMEREGKVEHAKGSAQKAYGDLKTDVKEVTK
ncbi:CsbD family protein [Thioalkalivibrio sp. XN279]|uniref:CsbD family protein n=1 Tax=Thioalkalivibrio sp. XN279 TaxID=2714953 RepID=UPI001409446D|nr:CsbD family protein [Thioalkalivibrio sp. XN279]NHA14639.1 CsbD family protein [Thioalkalivibrio sp. XN279]